LNIRIGYVGLSHLGLVSSVVTASKGYEVIGYDPDATLCRDLGEGRLPVHEPGLAELLTDDAARIRFTSEASDLGDCEVILISADVNTDNTDQSDLSSIDSLIKDAAAAASDGSTLVVLSQVPPGFTRKLSKTLKEDYGDREIELFCQVETLVFGNAVERAANPERIIVGCPDPASAPSVPYTGMLESFDCPVLTMGYESAELAKISINMCLVSSVSVANTMAELCEAVGADWSEIAPAVKLDRRIGRYAYLSPGLGLSGGNVERDLATVAGLAAEFGTDAGIVEAWLVNSRHRRDWALRTIHATLGPWSANAVVGIWGLAYKPETASTKNSPAVGLIEDLGEMTVRAYDPQARLEGLETANLVRCRSALEVCDGADVLVVMTPWTEFSSVDLEDVRWAMVGSVVIDPFGALDGERCARLGLVRLTLGSPTPAMEDV